MTPRQHGLLERLTRRHSTPQQLVQRAQLILHLEAGLPNAQIARLMQLNRGTVRYWRARWLQQTLRLTQAEADLTAVHPAVAPETETEPASVDKALRQLLEEALSDQPRTGAPVTFTAHQVVEIMALACEEPAASQRPVSHWTPRELAEEAIQRGIVTSISARSVGRFLKAGGAATASRGVLAAHQARRSATVCQPSDDGL